MASDDRGDWSPEDAIAAAARTPVREPRRSLAPGHSCRSSSPKRSRHCCASSGESTDPPCVIERSAGKMRRIVDDRQKR
jgi:hypothetical protein